MTIFEMAKHYYQDYTPPLWDKSRLDALLAAGKLTKKEYNEILNGKEK